MECERCFSTTILDDEHEVNRIRGNNYDIVTWEQVYTCVHCNHTSYKQESIRECVSTMDYMTDGLNMIETPARFGT